MFSFITEVWNPLGGECVHNCYGGKCWAKIIAKKFGLDKYKGEPRLDPKQMKKKFKDDDFVFVVDMNDLFAENVPSELILEVIKKTWEFPKTQFLFLTKNPSRYMNFVPIFGDNCVLGATIESNRIAPRTCNAENRLLRLIWMSNVAIKSRLRMFVSVEPIMDFDINEFVGHLTFIQPWAVAVGYDNYNMGLPEPELWKTEKLITLIEENGFTVYRKTLREKRD